MQTLRLLPLFLVASLLVGCASSVKRTDNGSASAPASTVVISRAKSVNIALTPDAREKLADNLKFNQETLVSTVRRALDAKNLIAKSDDAMAQSVDILVTDMRVRSNFSAVMFGFMAGSDSVTGDVILKDPQGRELKRFEVSASYALGGLGGGQDDARMGWLYEKFAELTLAELTGLRKE